jgi:superfamily II DNA or RNA helicase
VVARKGGGMTFSLRTYQQRVLDQLYTWWTQHPGAAETPICVMPTGSGKSVVIAELARLLFDTWPDEHPRTVVLVPSSDLGDQVTRVMKAFTHDTRVRVRAALGGIAMKWIRNAARAKKGHAMREKLAEELVAAFKGEGSAMKKREETHKMAEANKAFAHFRW